jgi:hypothetical protein
MHGRIAISSPAERRIRREARSETLRERALALRRAGWTLARIGQALGVSTTRVFQMARKAERLIAESIERDASPDNEAGTPIPGCPSDSNNDPFVADREAEQRPCLYLPPAT